MRYLSIVILFLCLAFSASAGVLVRSALVQGEPKTANDFFQVGFASANAGNYEQAIKNYNLAIGLDPTRIYFYYHRGLAHKFLGHKAEATNDFQQCNNMRPIAEAYYELGVLRYEAQDFAGAQNMLESARALKEDLDKTNFYLGLIYYKHNQWDSAESCLTRYTRIAKTHSDAYFYLATVKVKKHDYTDVAKLLQLASIYGTNDWKQHLKLYEVYKELGDKQGMLANISMVIEMGQTKPEYYNIRAQLYMAQGDPMRAQFDLDAAKGVADQQQP